MLRFRQYFKSVAVKEIEECYQNKIEYKVSIKEHFNNLQQYANEKHNNSNILISNTKSISNTDSSNSILVSKKNKFYFQYNNLHGYLTKRELEIWYCIVQGKILYDIYDILRLSTKTAESHIINIKNKLACEKLSYLTRILLKIGVMDNFTFAR